MALNINLQRRIDRIIGTAICGILSFFNTMKRPFHPVKKPANILVLLLSEMGSLILARPMLDRLKEKYPHASIHVLCFERNREFLEIIRGTPESCILTVRDDSLWSLFKDSLSVCIKMHRSRIDTAIDCELFSRISSIYSYLSGARIRAGFHSYTQEGLYRGNFINRPVLYNPYQHISDQFVNLVEAIESSSTPRVKRHVSGHVSGLPPMEIGGEEIRDYQNRVVNDFPKIKLSRLVLIYPSGGLLPIRAWPLKNFRLVAEDLIRNGYTVGIIGKTEDRHLADTFQSHGGHEHFIDFTGYTKTVRELMILFHIGKLLITNDGGPGHFASLTPIPSIVLFGPETPTLYGVLDNKSSAFYESLSCSPCLTAYNHRNSPCDGDNVCLKTIEPKKVIAKVREILETQKSTTLNYGINED